MVWGLPLPPASWFLWYEELVIWIWAWYLPWLQNGGSGILLHKQASHANILTASVCILAQHKKTASTFELRPSEERNWNLVRLNSLTLFQLGSDNFYITVTVSHVTEPSWNRVRQQQGNRSALPTALTTKSNACSALVWEGHYLFLAPPPLKQTNKNKLICG